VNFAVLDASHEIRFGIGGWRGSAEQLHDTVEVSVATEPADVFAQYDGVAVGE